MTTSLIEQVIGKIGSGGVQSILTPEELDELRYVWPAWARPSQRLPAGDWLTWLLMTGRGFGKNRTAAEAVRELVEAGKISRIALVGGTAADIRDVMVEGPSGIVTISPPWFRPVYEPSKRRITWPNGAVAITFTSEEPERLRGPEHDFAWSDELRTWKYAKEAWDNLQLGLRIGTKPRQIVTTTPRPIKVLRDLIKSPSTVVTTGSTYENHLNLSANFLQQILAMYEGTHFARQEIQGILLEDIPGALWKRGMFKERRSAPGGRYRRIVVAIDPSTTDNETSDEAGIVVAGIGADDELYYVLGDYSLRASPLRWAQAAISALDIWHGDRIVAEVNNGGDMVGLTIKAVESGVPFKAVTASRGKRVRAEPIAALYEQGLVFHAREFAELEDQLCTWTPDDAKSPDRLDALVWALSELSQRGQGRLRIIEDA